MKKDNEITRNNNNKYSNKVMIDDINDSNDSNDSLSKLSKLSSIIIPRGVLESGNFEGIIRALYPSKEMSFKEIAEITEISYEYVMVVFNRKKDYFQESNRKGNSKIWKLSPKGVNYVEIKIKDYEENQESIIENKRVKKIQEGITQELLKEAKEFFKLYSSDIERKGNIFSIDYQKLAESSPSLALELIQNAEEVLEILENAIQETLLIKEPKARFFNTPEIKNIENIRACDSNKLLTIQARVISTSEIRPQVVKVKFECPSCGAVISVLQIEKKLREPSHCSCGRKGRFKILNKITIDACRVILEDIQENTESPNAKRINAFLRQDLVSEENEAKLYNGNELLISGILKEIPIPLHSGGISTLMDFVLEVNNFKEIQAEVNPEDFTEKEIKSFEKLSNKISKNGLGELRKSYAPYVEGNETIKDSLIVQAVCRRNNPTKNQTRSKINVLIMSDPGMAKTQLGKFVIRTTPQSRKAVGGNSSGVGITASCMKDEFLGGYRLEFGALPLSKELLFLDELNNLADEDKSKLQEGLEDMHITVNKGNIRQSIKVTCGVLATANPRNGKFSKDDSLVRQVNLPPQILDRFDIIFLIVDRVDKDKDRKIARAMLKRFKGKDKPEYSEEFIKKFLTYIRHSFKDLKISEEAESLTENLYVDNRKTIDPDKKLSARFTNTLIRISHSMAKLRGGKIIEVEDVKRSFKLLSKSYLDLDFGIDKKLKGGRKN